MDSNDLALLSEYDLDGLKLPNRVVMAPMTRCRADNVALAPTDLHAAYYAQRAGAGLIVTEGVFVSPRATGYIRVPGIYSDAQLSGWRRVTDAVHAAGGRIFVQLWHVGAISHPSLQPGGALPIAPSAINPNDSCFTRSGPTPTETPRAMTVEEIRETIGEFAQAARNALTAGFDGAEIHGANGYLFQQFLSRSMNERTDEYGGLIANRCRFLLETIDAVRKAVPGLRLGLRLNPALHGLSGIRFDDETLPLYHHLMEKLAPLGLSYLHLMEPINPTDETGFPRTTVATHFRPLFNGTIISATDHTRESGEDMLRRNDANLVAFGRAFISNPDLVQRFARNAPLAVPNRDTFYQGGPQGYIDYPALDEAFDGVTVGSGERVDMHYGSARKQMRSKD